MVNIKRETRNVLIGGQIKFHGARWTAPGLDRHVRKQARISYPVGLNWNDPELVNGPLVQVGSVSATLRRVVPS